MEGPGCLLLDEASPCRSVCNEAVVDVDYGADVGEQELLVLPGDACSNNDLAIFFFSFSNTMPRVIANIPSPSVARRDTLTSIPSVTRPRRQTLA